MAITGAVGAALRQEAPYQAEIAMGALLIVDFQGARSGRRPYYWYRGTRYTSPEKIPGWSFSRASSGYAEDVAGNLIQFPANTPRITDKGLVIEGARTNLLLNSKSIGGTSWNLNAAPTVALNSIVAPDGTATATQFTTSLNVSGAFQTVAVTSGATHTWGVYVKLLSGSGLLKLGTEATPVSVLTFDPANGAITAPGAGLTTYGARALASGWWFVWGTYVAADNNDTLTLYSADATPKSFAFWQADLQAGPFITSPIVTTTAAATRAADNASVSNLALILASQATLAVSSDNFYGGPNAVLYPTSAALVASGSPTQNAVILGRDISTANWRVSGRASGAVMGGADANIGVMTTKPTKAAIRMNSVAPRAAALGVLSSAWTPSGSSLPSGLDTLWLGNSAGGNNPINGYIQRVMIFGDVDDAQLTRLAA